MRKLAVATVLAGSVFLMSGCAAMVGGAVGVGGTATAYEIHLDSERARVQKAYDDGKMDKQEYEIRIDQIRRDSAVQ